MRKVTHRALSALPMFALAYVGVWATAFPVQAAEAYNRFQVLLMSDERFFWLCVALIAGYALLWWFTSLEPKPRRKKIQEGLRPFAKRMRNLRVDLLKVENDAEFTRKEEELGAALGLCLQWVMDNMGESAFTKINHPNVQNLLWSWPTNPDSELKDFRNQVINLQAARVEVLDLFLQSDGWDGKPTPKRALLKRRYSAWKEKRKTASTAS